MNVNYLYNKSSINHDKYNRGNERYDLGSNFLNLIMTILEINAKIINDLLNQQY